MEGNLEPAVVTVWKPFHYSGLKGFHTSLLSVDSWRRPGIWT